MGGECGGAAARARAPEKGETMTTFTRSWLIAAAALAAVPLAAPGGAAPPSAAGPRLAQSLEAFLEAHPADPGIALVVRTPRLRWGGAAGVADRASGAPLAANATCPRSNVTIASMVNRAEGFIEPTLQFQQKVFRLVARRA